MLLTDYELRTELPRAIYIKRMFLEAKYNVNIFIEDGHLICRGSTSTDCCVHEFFSPECAQEFEDYISSLEQKFKITTSKRGNTLEVYNDPEEPFSIGL